MLVAAAGLAACGGPGFADGSFLCGAANECPPGFACVEGRCLRGTTQQMPDLDSAEAVDGADVVTDGATPVLGVWSHDYQNLFAVDLATVESAPAGAFAFSDGALTGMLDLAMTPDGSLIGSSNSAALYRVQPDASCAWIGSLPAMINSLTAMPDGTLMGATYGGDVYRIGPDWVAELVGNLALGNGADGDIAWDGARGRLLALIRRDGLTTLLASVDPSTGTATEIGDTASIGLFGLVVVDGRILAFGNLEVRELDPATGATTVTYVAATSFYGAASAP